MRRTKTRALAAVGAAATMVVVGALPSTARTEVTRENLSYNGFYFDNIATGAGGPDLILFADARLADHCSGTLVPIYTRWRVVGEPPATGAGENESFVQRGPLELYDGMGMTAPDFVEYHCNKPIEDRPEPIGVGEGLIQAGLVAEWFGNETPPAATQTDSVRGSVRTKDGQRLVVRGEAALTLSPTFTVNHVSVEILNR